DPPALDHAIRRDPDGGLGQPGRPPREPVEQRGKESGPDRDQRRLCRREPGKEPNRRDDEPHDGARLERHDSSSRTGPGTDATAASTASAGSIRCTQGSGASVSLCARAGIDIALMSSGVTKSRPRYAARARASFISASEPLGEAPTASCGDSLVARAIATAYSASGGATYTPSIAARLPPRARWSEMGSSSIRPPRPPDRST